MLYTEVIDNAKSLTDTTGTDAGGTSAELTAWMATDYAELTSRLSFLVPDHYLTSEVKVIASGNSFTITANEPWSRVLRVSRLSGLVYSPFPKIDPLKASSAERLGWRQRGRTVEIWPLANAIASYTVDYVSPQTMPTVVDLDLPPGFSKILEQELAIRIRIRLEQDTSPHAKEIERLWKMLLPTITPTSSTPTAVSDWNDSDY